VPQSSDADGYVQALPTPFLKFTQCQVCLRGNPAAQSGVMIFQTRTPIAPDFFGLARAGEAVLVPKTLHTFAADTETPANLAGTLTALPGRDDSLSQILTQRPHNFLFMEKE
jgi:hypothetical protein